MDTSSVSSYGHEASSPVSGQHSNQGEETKVDIRRYKTRMCRNFERQGFCPYETRCMFAHGPHELRTPEENERDGMTTEAAIKRHQQQMAFVQRTTLPPPPPVPTACCAPPPPCYCAHCTGCYCSDCMAIPHYQPSACACPSCVPSAHSTYTHSPYAMPPQYGYPAQAA